MKKYAVGFLCVFVAASALAENKFLQGMRGSQRTAPPEKDQVVKGPATTPVSNAPAVIAEAGAVAKGESCTPDKQKSIPLAFLNSMAGDSRGVVVTYDEQSDSLKMKASDFASNCSRMIKYELSSPTSSVPEYVVRAKIDDCGSAECSYSVTKVVDGKVVTDNEFKAAPTFNGFLQCLQHTGVLKADGSSNEQNILRQSLDQTWENVRATGSERVQVVYAAQDVLSTSADRIPPMHSSIRPAADCYVLEKIMADGVTISSPAIREQEDQREQATLLCRDGNRDDMRNFVERVGPKSLYGQIVAAALEKSVLKDVQGIADSLKNNKGNLKDLDLSVLDEFERRIIEPMTREMTELYLKIQKLPANDPQRRKAEKRLEELSAQLAKYRNSPYLTAADVDRLAKAGRFNEAETLNRIVLTVGYYKRLGGEDSKGRITPQAAAKNIQYDMEDYIDSQRQARVDWDVRTGRITGRSGQFTSLAKSLEQDIANRNITFPKAIEEQYKRMGGACQRMILSISIQKCVEAAQQCIVRLQKQWQTWNQDDLANIERMKKRAAHYARLEAEAQSSGDDEEDQRGPASASQDDLVDEPQRNPTVAQVDQENVFVPNQGQGQSQPFASERGGWNLNNPVFNNGVQGQQQGGQWYGNQQPGQVQGQMGQFGNQQGAWNYGQGGMYNQSGMNPTYNQYGQLGLGMNPQSMGWGSTFNYQAMQNPGQYQMMQPFNGQFGYGQTPLSAQGSFFAGTQPYAGWNNFQGSQQFMNQPGMFSNPMYQNFQGGTGAWNYGM